MFIDKVLNGEGAIDQILYHLKEHLFIIHMKIDAQPLCWS